MNIQYDFDNEAESRLYKLVIEKAIKAKTIGRTDEFVVKVDDIVKEFKWHEQEQK